MPCERCNLIRINDKTSQLLTGKPRINKAFAKSLFKDLPLLPAFILHEWETMPEADKDSRFEPNQLIKIEFVEVDKGGSGHAAMENFICTFTNLLAYACNPCQCTELGGKTTRRFMVDEIVKMLKQASAQQDSMDFDGCSQISPEDLRELLDSIPTKRNGKPPSPSALADCGWLRQTTSKPSPHAPGANTSTKATAHD